MGITRVKIVIMRERRGKEEWNEKVDLKVFRLLAIPASLKDSCVIGPPFPLVLP